jgi:hypothetical protein
MRASPLLKLFLVAFVVMLQCPPGAIAKEKVPGDASLNTKFQFIGAWKGPSSIGTVVLISPSWVLTAGHVAGLKAKEPDRHITIRFDDGTKTTAAEAFVAPEGDLALVKLADPVKNITPATLLDKSFTKDDGEIEFTLAGHSGELHVHPGQKGKASSEKHFHRSSTKEDTSPGRAGDSGGAWAVQDTDHNPIVFAIIHGGGLANQVAPIHEWLDTKLKSTHEKANWKSWKK